MQQLLGFDESLSTTVDDATATQPLPLPGWHGRHSRGRRGDVEWLKFGGWINVAVPVAVSKFGGCRAGGWGDIAYLAL
jgi:hypothetical protein